jgi:hypothetical protein
MTQQHWLLIVPYSDDAVIYRGYVALAMRSLNVEQLAE